MWSDSYRDYVKQLVITNRDEYPYYIAHTCSYWGISNSSSYPSFKVYLSKEPITASGLYNYVCRMILWFIVLLVVTLIVIIIMTVLQLL